jgi:hypothetical protein
MRVSIVASVAAIALGVILASEADGARKPTPSERTAVTLALLQVVQLQGPNPLFVARRVAVSTVRPGSGSRYSRFAAVFGVQSGPPAGPRIALVGRSRLTGYWVGVTYGSPRNLCDLPERFFGGRQAAILTDLGVRCQ